MELEKYSFIMAKRLKTLREENGLSHDKLSKALLEKYNIKISSDSLMNYEVTDEHHTKARKNQGMSVKYLYCLSDFFGVSSDYLLGLSDAKTSNINVTALMEEIGISEDNANILITANDIANSFKAFKNPIDRANIVDQHYHFLKKIGMLDFVSGTNMNARVYTILGITSGIPQFINDIMSAILSDLDLIYDYKYICSKTIPILRERYRGGFSAVSFDKDSDESLDKGYAIIPVEDFFELKVSKVVSSINDFLHKKYGPTGYAWKSHEDKQSD